MIDLCHVPVNESTDRGEHTRDSIDSVPMGRLLGDLCRTAISGVALFPHPDHPDYAPYWQIRPYILSMSWPGSRPYVTEPGQSVTLAYRMMIHRGDATVECGCSMGCVHDGDQRAGLVRGRATHRTLQRPRCLWTQVGTATFELQEGRLRGHGNEPRTRFHRSHRRRF